jgi:hypothetical protein
MGRYMVVLNLLALSLFTGCGKTDVFFRIGKIKRVTQNQYQDDPLLLRNHAIYNSRMTLSFFAENKPFPLEKDSLRQLVFDVFKGLDIDSLKIVGGENIIDSTLYQHPFAFNLRRIKSTYLNELAGNTEGVSVLVPLVYGYNRISFTGFISSGGLAGSSGWYFISYLDLIVYIVKDQKVIYSRHIRYKSDQVWADSEDEILAVPPLAAVKQEHWDELVRQAMKDYIKRLK